MLPASPPPPISLLPLSPHHRSVRAGVGGHPPLPLSRGAELPLSSMETPSDSESEVSEAKLISASVSALKPILEKDLEGAFLDAESIEALESDEPPSHSDRRVDLRGWCLLGFLVWIVVTDFLASRS